MSNDNNNNPPRILSNGLPNLQGNPRVLAAFIDLIGQNITTILNRLSNTNSGLTNNAPLIIADDDVQLLIDLQRLLGVMRDSVGIGEEWHDKNLCLEVRDVTRERNEREAARNAALLKLMDEMGMPIPAEIRAALTPRPSAAESANSILDALRADGVIG
jgi:hypothetical protein